jgi:anti-sigma factor RsiW
MTCEQAQPLLSAYVDRELDITKSLETEDHLRECPRCSAALQQHEALRSGLNAASLAFVAPTGLERRVRKALRREAQPKVLLTIAPWRWAAVPMAATLAAALTWSVAIHRGGTTGEDVVLSDLVAGHVRSLMVDHLVDVATSDQHTVKPWFNGKVDFAPPVADFTASGFPLVGGRVDYIAGRPAAALVYRRRQHVVNVFIWPSGQQEAEALRNVTFDTYHLLRWSASGLTFWAVSDVSGADLESLERLFQNPT